MNTDQVIGNWRQFKGEAQRRWGKLTNDQLDQIDGNREKLAGEIQTAYGLAREQAEDQIREWEKKVNRDAA
ncbi:MAG: CsbD family protein [Bdellovibrionales bacterium]